MTRLAAVVAGLLSAFAPVVAVLLVSRSAWILSVVALAFCPVLTASRDACVMLLSRSVNHRARRRLLAEMRRMADRGARIEPGDRLRDAVHAAAGVAIRSEPKPGAACSALAVAGSEGGVVLALVTVTASGFSAVVVTLVAWAMAAWPIPVARDADSWRAAGRFVARRRTLAVVLSTGCAALVLSAGPAVAHLLAAPLVARAAFAVVTSDLSGVVRAGAARRRIRDVRELGGQAAAVDARVLVVPREQSRLGFATVAENVLLTGARNDVPRHVPVTVALCGLDEVVAGLDRGWNTVLSAEFHDGHDVGEWVWERVLAARVSARIELGARCVLLAAEPSGPLAAVLEEWRRREDVRVEWPR